MRAAKLFHWPQRAAWLSGESTVGWLRYVVAAGAVALALLARLGLDPFLGKELQPYATLYVAVAAIAWWGGLRPALFSLVLGLLAGFGLLVLPRESAAVRGIPDVTRIVTYLFVTGTTVLLMELLHRTERRAKINAQTAQRKQSQLEDEIRQHRQTEAALRQSQLRLRAILDNSPALIFLKDVEGRYLQVNPQFERCFNLSREQVLGRTDSEMFPPQQATAFRTNDRKVLEAGGPLEFEEVARYRDGIHTSIVCKFPLHDPAGKVYAVGGVVTDITRRKRAEEALRESEHRYRTLIEAMPQLVWTTLPDGTTDYASSQWEHYTGLPLENSLGFGWIESVHPEDRGRAVAAWNQAVTTRTTHECDFRLRDANGNYRWFKSRGVPLRNPEGQIVKWFGTCTDITAVVEAQEALARSQEELELLVQDRTARLQEVIAELEHLSYTLAHDMRAPLRAMQGFAVLMQRECTACRQPRVLDFCQRIIGGAERLDRLIVDALNYTRVVRHNIPLHAVDLAKLLRGLVETYPDLQPPKAEIRIEEDLPRVLGNEAALTQCFANLLGNAIRFVAPGVKPRIRVWAEAVRSAECGVRSGADAPRTTQPDSALRTPHSALEMVRIWVEDNGIGIPREAQQRIFDLFQRLHGGCEGTGLGLAIVRKAVERMGGKAGVESEPGKGSRFWVELKPA
jgi:PAS domain S-box-containing protein